MKTFAQSPVLKPVYNPYSVKYYVFVNGRIKDLLCTINQKTDVKHVRINYKRVKYWLSKGLSLHYTSMFFAERIYNHRKL